MPQHFKKHCQNKYRKSVMKTIKNHVFLNGKIIQIHCNKNMVFEGYADCVRELKMYQKSYQTLGQILSKIG